MKYKEPVRAILSVLIVLYPVFVFLSLMVFHLPMSIISMGMLVMGVCGYLANAKDSSWWMPVLIGLIAIILIVTQSELVLKFYPICITLVFLGLFGGSLIKKDSVVFHFALLMDSSIQFHPGKAEIQRYCKRVTQIWTIWLILSLTINFYLAFFGTLEQWAIYNGPVCWVIQGLIFVVEFIVRYYVNNRIAVSYDMPKQGFFDFFRNITKRGAK